MVITSLRNPRVRSAVKLRDRRGRDTQRRIIIDGAREILRAFESQVRLTEYFVCADLCQSEDAKQAFACLAQSNVLRNEVSPHVLEKLSFGDRTEGIVAVAEVPRKQLDDIPVNEHSLIAVVERIEKPGNLGAILRTADAAGVSAVVAAEPVCDIFNPNVIRASLGAVFTLPVVGASTDDAISWLRANGVAIFAARVDGSVPYTDIEYSGPAAIVLGSEAAGLTERWSGSGVTAISLPMRGSVDSLNVSATAAVLFYEARR